MCERDETRNLLLRTIPLAEAINSVLAHDITEIRPGEFKGRAFRRGHVIREEDLCHLRRLGKERLFVMEIPDGYMHEDDAAEMLAGALAGEGVEPESGPKEGKINLVAQRDGLLRVIVSNLKSFNMHGEVICATLHDNTVVKKNQVVAATRAVPLLVRSGLVDSAVEAALGADGGVVSVREMKRPKVGVVITGNEVFQGRVKDAFEDIIAEKVSRYEGEIIRAVYAPDDEGAIEDMLRGLMQDGADLLVTTGGMSVDPDDVTRLAIRHLGAGEFTYGCAVLPGSMFLVAYIGDVPVLGVPACGVHHKTTVFDIVLPRVLAGERIGREELAELGHGGLCLSCDVCRYPICPFGK